MGPHDVLRAIFASGAENSVLRNRGDSPDTVTEAPNPLKKGRNPVTPRPQPVSPRPNPWVTHDFPTGDRDSSRNPHVSGQCHPVTTPPGESDPVALALATLSADDLDAFEERTAILEYEAGMPRREAERVAARAIADLRGGHPGRRADR